MNLTILSPFKARTRSVVLLCLLTLSSLSSVNATNNLPYYKNACTKYPSNLWKGLLTEAAGESYEGMHAVACCVRNRFKAKMNHGLVGLERKDLECFVWKESKNTRHLAIEAVDNVFCHNSLDVTNGATFFESIDFIKNFKRWSRNKVILAHIGKHYFHNYRSKQ